MLPEGLTNTITYKKRMGLVYPVNVARWVFMIASQAMLPTKLVFTTSLIGCVGSAYWGDGLRFSKIGFRIRFYTELAVLFSLT